MQNPRARHSQNYSSEGPLETILPVQFHSRYRNRQMEALKRLMFAMLEHAVKCFQANLGARSREKRREFLEAEWWLFKANGVGPFSFESVCEVLGVHPDYVRRSLAQWRAAKRIYTDGAAGDLSQNPPEIRRRSRLSLSPATTPTAR